jgi:hypothetical protein
MFRHWRFNQRQHEALSFYREGNIMRELPAISVEINETRKAFRVNGVTVAKRHLENTLKFNHDDPEKTLARFLVIVPFLATSFTPDERASASVKYGAAKAKRIYEAIGLNEENTIPFMLVALKQAGEDVPNVITLDGNNLPFPESLPKTLH